MTPSRKEIIAAMRAEVDAQVERGVFDAFRGYHTAGADLKDEVYAYVNALDGGSVYCTAQVDQLVEEIIGRVATIMGIPTSAALDILAMDDELASKMGYKVAQSEDSETRIDSYENSPIGVYFDTYTAPALRSSGTPEDGVSFMRKKYIESVLVNPDAQEAISRSFVFEAEHPDLAGFARILRVKGGDDKIAQVSPQPSDFPDWHPDSEKNMVLNDIGILDAGGDQLAEFDSDDVQQAIEYFNSHPEAQSMVGYYYSNNAEDEDDVTLFEKTAQTDENKCSLCGGTKDAPKVVLWRPTGAWITCPLSFHGDKAGKTAQAEEPAISYDCPKCGHLNSVHWADYAPIPDSSGVLDEEDDYPADALICDNCQAHWDGDNAMVLYDMDVRNKTAQAQGWTLEELQDIMVGVNTLHLLETWGWTQVAGPHPYLSPPTFVTWDEMEDEVDSASMEVQGSRSSALEGSLTIDRGALFAMSDCEDVLWAMFDGTTIEEALAQPSYFNNYRKNHPNLVTGSKIAQDDKASFCSICGTAKVKSNITGKMQCPNVNNHPKKTASEIPVLNMTPKGSYAFNGGDYYEFPKSYKNVMVCNKGFDTPETAFDDARIEGRGYEQKHYPGGMAQALGVALTWRDVDAKWLFRVSPDGKYHGVYAFAYSDS